ncbi:MULTISPECIES: SDR family NAD(P)-dependent oxidoreductase [unclassified Streptomyces]|uniref:SDR family NAD(P)-dependent oxidoreductase n=1 Tax=unclassified Streptomyces TaxID=2593676 RepID=UPI00081E9FFF|nr:MULTISPECIES: SDR family NAD(P)-dependent oxidoreductase [unclassified Streptomyces]MYZ33805.1 glucose 1-dehydrogenase [Streptomyces sp. SID4917]SCF61897.1 NAD(P)-dependent dehydrogenase, short-chain alcohol dehydrogenase family [Streptomyces sp. MnatMP-M17]
MSRDREFENKVAIVTGAGTGMGAATAILLAERGAKVALVGRRETPLHEVAAAVTKVGSEAICIPADVSDSDAMQHAVTATVDSFGALHFAVNNAGISSEHRDLPDLPNDVWDNTIATNLSSIYYGMKAELPAIEASGGGAIVNVSSVYADRGLPFRAAYSASKHGIRGITRSAANDWAARGVRINELQPGVIATPMLAAATQQETEATAAIIAAKRLGEPREIATAVAFLLSDDASYITGAHLAVDGGFLT